jgi:predicted PurR-regulated permease PerM
VLLALVQLGWVHAASFLGVIIVANILFGNIVEPLLMGKRLGLSTLVVTLALVFWGWLWGPVGMLLSVPLTMVLKIVVQNIPDLAWIHIVLSDWKEPTPPPPPPPAEEVPPPNESPASPSPAE